MNGFLILRARRVAELLGIRPRHRKSKCSLGTIQWSRTAELNLLEIGGVPAFEGSLETLVGSWIYYPCAVLLDALGIGARLVLIFLLIAVRCVGRNTNQSFMGCCRETDFKAGESAFVNHASGYTGVAILFS